MMISNIIQSTSMQEAQARFPLPQGLEIALGIFKTTHILYRDAKDFLRLKEKPTLSNPLIYGVALNAIAPLTNVTEQALQVCLITKCVSHIIDQYEKVHLAYRIHQDAWANRYPTYRVKKIDSFKYPTEPHTWWSAVELRLLYIPSRLIKIGSSVGPILLELFKLSMRLQDANLICNKDSAQKRQACTELVADLQDYKERLGNPQFLEQEMKTQNVMIDTILNKLHTNKNAVTLLRELKINIEHIKNNEIASELGESIATVARELLGNGSNSLSISFAVSPPLDTELAGYRYSPWGGENLTLQGQVPLAQESLNEKREQAIEAQPLPDIITLARTFFEKGMKSFLRGLNV